MQSLANVEMAVEEVEGFGQGCSLLVVERIDEFEEDVGTRPEDLIQRLLTAARQGQHHDAAVRGIGPAGEMA